jgi:methyl-accepting chemotaxis protein
MAKKFISFLFSIIVLSSVNLFAEDNLIKIESHWAMSHSSMDEPDGKYVKMPGFVPVPSKNTFWINTETEIPAEFMDKPLYIETGSTNVAMEIYINGTFAGSHGTIEPKLSVNHVTNTLVRVPDEFKKDGKIRISSKCKTHWSHANFSQFYFTDEARYYKCFTKQNFLNTTIYYMMAAICIFLSIYFILQLVSDHREHSSLYFSWSLLFIGIYFFDMATDILFIPANLQLSISRYCLLLSMGTLSLFIFRFFGHRAKLPKYIIFVVFAIFGILYYINSKNAINHENIFTISLAPVFGAIIFIYITLIRSFKNSKINAKILLVGITAGLSFGVHDIIYQATGRIPFAWLQGFSFFFIDMTMFIVISINTIKNKKAINSFAETTSEQKNRLDSIMDKARQLSDETKSIAQKLNEAAISVSEAANESARKASGIGDCIMEQNKAVRNTSNAVDNLMNSVQLVVSEVENETQVVDSTIKETKLLIDGVNNAALGVENAANFTATLGQKTQESTEDITRLVSCMEAVKTSSTEIQSIVKVVTDFFHRTNMLAMNASIEAAHSGIAGKGFAVIAHEIKKLSEASSAQAERITEIISDIDENITEGFDLSKSLQEVLANAAEQATTTAVTVNDSVKSMDMQRSVGNKINEATTIMAESAAAVKEETKNQYTIAQEVTENMMQLSEYADNAENEVTIIIANSTELSKQTEALRDLVSRIRDAALELTELING